MIGTLFFRNIFIFLNDYFGAFTFMSINLNFIFKIQIVLVIICVYHNLMWFYGLQKRFKY